MISAFGKWILLVAVIAGCLGAPLQAYSSLLPDGSGNFRVEEPDPLPPPPDPDPLPIPGEVIAMFSSWGYGDFSWGAISTEMVTAPAFGFPKAGIKIACSKRHH